MADNNSQLVRYTFLSAGEIFKGSNALTTKDGRDFSFILVVPEAAGGGGTSASVVDAWIEESSSTSFVAGETRKLSLTKSDGTVVTDFDSVAGDVAVNSPEQPTLRLQKLNLLNSNPDRFIRGVIKLTGANVFGEVVLRTVYNSKV